MKKRTRFLVEAGLIAALYAGLTYLSGIVGLAFGPIQFRLSEALTVLPALTPAAIPGLAIGCLLANMFSFNPLDLLFGTLATLLAAVATYGLRKIKFRTVPVLAPLPPVLFNAAVIGFEIAVYYTVPDGGKWSFGIAALCIGVGQLAVCYGIGLPFFRLVEKSGLFKGNNSDRKG